jgi:hypothetical protein
MGMDEKDERNNEPYNVNMPFFYDLSKFITPFHYNIPYNIEILPPTFFFQEN